MWYLIFAIACLCGIIVLVSDLLNAPPDPEAEQRENDRLREQAKERFRREQLKRHK